jgi:hypothetical protein
VREYVGYEEWTGGGFLRREVARCGVALNLAFGDELDVHDGGTTTSHTSPATSRRWPE